MDVPAPGLLQYCTIDRNLSHVPHASVLVIALDGDRGHLTIYQPDAETTLDG
jgi:hypothetical protein